MHSFKLERQRYTDESIIGSFYIDGEFQCFSLELPWRDNKRGISCVPVGVYDLVPHMYKGKLKTVALVNKELGVLHFNDETATRSTILIHPGNWPSEIDGCILAGEVAKVNSVFSSRDAVTALIEKIQRLNIKQLEII